MQEQANPLCQGLFLTIIHDLAVKKASLSIHNFNIQKVLQFHKKLAFKKYFQLLDGSGQVLAPKTDAKVIAFVAV